MAKEFGAARTLPNLLSTLSFLTDAPPLIVYQGVELGSRSRRTLPKCHYTTLLASETIGRRAKDSPQNEAIYRMTRARVTGSLTGGGSTSSCFPVRRSTAKSFE